MSFRSRVRRWSLELAWRYHRRRGHARAEERALRRLGRLLERRGDVAAALGNDHAERELAALLQRQGNDREAALRYRELRCHYLAAEAFSRLGDWQQAARSFHLSASFQDAARCWERWLESIDASTRSDDPAGAVLADVALCYDRLGQTRRAAELYREALEILDTHAARHEAAGRLQAARAAYLAIAHIGHSKGAYESIACGLAGAIRVSKRGGGSEHRLLGYYDDFIHYALRFGEFASAAELCVEAAELKSSQASARNYLVRAGDNWLRNGDFLYVELDRAELATASYHAAIECYLRAHEHVALVSCYSRLAVVAEASRREEFTALSHALAAEAAREDRPGQAAWRDQSPEEWVGLEAGATPEALEKAYFEAIRRHPPDTDFERFESLTRAFELLSDERKRARYQRLLGRPAATATR